MMPGISRKAPPANSYHWTQVALHWLVASLVAVQFATGSSIGRVHDAVARGLDPEPPDLLMHAIHNRVGLTIFALMIVRLTLRLLVGVPDPPGAKSAWRPRLARATHASFYVVLLVQASTGAVASYLYWPVSVVHGPLSKALLALIALHACAALWHLFIARDGAMQRMLGLRAP
jgi:cytochrome b561